MSDFKKRTIRDDAEKFLDKLDENTLFIYSETSLKNINFNNENVKKISWHEISKNIKAIDSVVNENKNITQVVSLGGGSAIDIAKYISDKLNVKFTCIPSMLSTNSYATNKVALIENDQKITLEAKLPDCVLLDCNLLKKSMTENLYGLADVLSIYTASYDWEIAAEDIDEKIDENIFGMSQDLLDKVKSFISNNTLEDISNDIEQLYEYIGISGHITNLYGTGRPESGSEHIFAKKVESMTNVPHGIVVAIGTILMGLMQGREVDEIINAVQKINVLEKCSVYGVNMNLIEQALMSLVPREERYTIVNRFYKNNTYKKEKFELFKTLLIEMD